MIQMFIYYDSILISIAKDNGINLILIHFRNNKSIYSLNSPETFLNSAQHFKPFGSPLHLSEIESKSLTGPFLTHVNTNHIMP